MVDAPLILFHQGGEGPLVPLPGLLSFLCVEGDFTTVRSSMVKNNDAEVLFITFAFCF